MSLRWAAVLFVLVAALPAASAGVDIDFGASVPLGDDGRLFVSVSSRLFEHEPRVVEAWVPRYRNPDDLAVALFISRHSGRPLDAISSMRAAGTGWWDIGLRCGVPVDVWFVPVERDPGPPYGKAYGHWKKHKHDRSRLVLRDSDVRNLVAVQVMHEYYGLPAERAMELRAGGTDVRTLVANEYRGRHGGEKSHKADDPGDHGHDHHGKKDKSHGKHKK